MFLRKLTRKTRQGSLHLDRVGYRFPLWIMSFYVCNIWGDLWYRLICLLTVAHFHYQGSGGGKERALARSLACSHTRLHTRSHTHSHTLISAATSPPIISPLFVEFMTKTGLEMFFIKLHNELACLCSEKHLRCLITFFANLSNLIFLQKQPWKRDYCK